MLKFMMLAMCLGMRLQDEDPNAGGGAGGAGDPPADDNKVKDPEAVLKKNQELLASNAAIKAENERLKKEADEAAQKIKDQEAADLLAKQDYKALFERSEAERIENKKKQDEKDAQLEKGAKLASLQSELIKLGINPERVSLAMQVAQLNSIKYDIDHKVVSNADVEAMRLKMVSPEWFGARDPENFGAGDPPAGNRPGVITMEEYLKLPKAKQKELYPQMMKDVAGVTIKK